MGDFRGDGKLDLAVASADRNNVSVLLGNGDGTFQGAVTYAVGSDPTSIGVGDFNGDGKLDIVVANDAGGVPGASSVSVLLGTGTGTFLQAQNFAQIVNSDGTASIAPRAAQTITPWRWGTSRAPAIQAWRWSTLWKARSS